MGGNFTHRLGLFTSSAADVSLLGALAYRTTDTTVDTTTPYDAEAYDNGGWHDISSNTDRFTVPSGVDYARCIATTIHDSGTLRLTALKGGANFAGQFLSAQSDTPGADAVSAATAIVAVTAGDYFSFDPEGSTVSGDWTETGSWGAIEAIPSTRKMALVSKSGNQAISAATTTTLDWGAEIRDTDAFHDTVTNNSRLTVPSGISLVRISAFLVASANGTQMVISFLKNGGSVPGLPQQDQQSWSRIGAVSAILAVSAADYFECRAFHTEGANINANNATWFQIEEIPAATKYALVNKSGTQAISAATFTALAFGAETADADGFHDNSTNNSRLTVPSGVTQARLSFNVTTPSTAGQFIAEVRKNGSAGVAGMPRQETDTAGGDSVNGFGAWVDVTPGDYFEVFVYSDNGQTLAVADTTWFCIEAR
jgi:hypothetical protein